MEYQLEQREKAEPSGGKLYAYRYPRNLLSWFFLAQRHRYVRSVLLGPVNLDIGANEYKVTGNSIGVDLKIGNRPDVVCSALALPFADGSFGSCTMLEVIEHMDARSQSIAVREVRRVMKKNGQFIISTPNMVYGLFNVVWWVWERTGGRRWLHEHVGMGDPRQFERLLTDGGFRVRGSKRVAIFDRIIDSRCLK